MASRAVACRLPLTAARRPYHQHHQQQQHQQQRRGLAATAAAAAAAAAANAAAATPAQAHVPVLLEDVVRFVDPRPGRTVVDATFGAGGYTRRFLELGATVVAVDRDPAACALAHRLAEVPEHRGRLLVAQGCFSALAEVVAGALRTATAAPPVAAVVFDAGVCSTQLDNGARGFSFQRDGPLDMRMGGPTNGGVSAYDVVNEYPVPMLESILQKLGEEVHHRAIATAIDRARRTRPLQTTLELAAVIASAVPHAAGPARARSGSIGPRRIHAATRTFQALRIFVNRELMELSEGLKQSERLLPPGGTLAVISYHSLEDAIVKDFAARTSGHAFDPVTHEARPSPIHRSSREYVSASGHATTGPVQPTFRTVTRHCVVPARTETEANVRARSARMRVLERTDVVVAV